MALFWKCIFVFTSQIACPTQGKLWISNPKMGPIFSENFYRKCSWWNGFSLKFNLGQSFKACPRNIFSYSLNFCIICSVYALVPWFWLAMKISTKVPRDHSHFWYVVFAVIIHKRANSRPFFQKIRLYIQKRLKRLSVQISCSINDKSPWWIQDDSLISGWQLADD